MSRVELQRNGPLMEAAPDLYGLFFEDINRGGDGGLYPEMLRNRSFEDSIVPDDCRVVQRDGSEDIVNTNGWGCPFHHGEGKAEWAARVPETPVPAWYTKRARLEPDFEDVLNAHRRAALQVTFAPGGMLWNIGYGGMAVQEGETYIFSVFAKAEMPCLLTVEIAETEKRKEREYGQIASDRESRGSQNLAGYEAMREGKESEITSENCGAAVPQGDRAEARFGARCTDLAELEIAGASYRRYEVRLKADRSVEDAVFVLRAPEGGAIKLGFCSLMPARTYHQHGLRRDLAELLEQSHGRFLRFPGGCVVEGFTRETMLRFSNTIGPVWERPSHNLMWYYRTTNGLGYHEFLQFCEDAGMEAMYVVNAGISCQVRGPVYAEGEELDGWLQEAICAVEYATAPADTYWGDLRARAGHPEPFRLKYLEIGNENMGPEYAQRYRKFYGELHARYPELILISNTHTEKDGLSTQVADEHYYDTPEFFAENRHQFDSYDRSGPAVFIGELQAFQGPHTETLYAALCEAMFLLGAEKNQDLVRLITYAPMLQHLQYTVWYPDLVVYDHRRSFGTASYHMMSVLAGARGAKAVRTHIESPDYCFAYEGVPGLGASGPGMKFCDARMNGRPIGLGRFLQNYAVEQDGVYVTAIDPSQPVAKPFPGMPDTSRYTYLTFDAKPCRYGEFTVRICAKAGQAVILTALNRAEQAYIFTEESHGEEVWNHRTVRNYRWIMENGTSRVVEPSIWGDRALCDGKPCEIKPEVWHELRMVGTEYGFDCYVDSELIHQARQPRVPVIDCVTELDDTCLYVKLLHLADGDEPVELHLGEDVESEYELCVLGGGNPYVRNTMEHPDAVHPVRKRMYGAGASFTYCAPPYSLSVLKLRRKK